MISYATSTTDSDLYQILALQQKNLEANISNEESVEQGFVTVHHDFALLSAMNRPFPHIIARDGDQVVGYALVMQRSFADEIPVLVPMFEQINTHIYENEKLESVQYFIMGQVCIDKAYRGKGIFRGLYNQMRRELSEHFKYVITEVAERNQRSMRAHEKVGFKSIKVYGAGGEKWVVLLWDWT